MKASRSAVAYSDIRSPRPTWTLAAAVRRKAANKRQPCQLCKTILGKPLQDSGVLSRGLSCWCDARVTACGLWLDSPKYPLLLSWPCCHFHPLDDIPEEYQLLSALDQLSVWSDGSVAGQYVTRCLTVLKHHQDVPTLDWARECYNQHGVTLPRDCTNFRLGARVL